MGFSCYTDIKSWKQARALTGTLYKVTASGRFKQDFGLRDQIRRASVSIMANIAEGFGRGGNRQFAQFLSYARASALEVQSHLYIAHDVGYLDEESFGALVARCSDIIALISGLMRYLNQSEHPGYTSN